MLKKAIAMLKKNILLIVAIALTILNGIFPVAMGVFLLNLKQGSSLLLIPAAFIGLLSFISCIGIYKAKKWGAWLFVISMTIYYLLIAGDNIILLDGISGVKEMLRLAKALLYPIFLIWLFFFSKHKEHFNKPSH